MKEGILSQVSMSLVSGHISIVVVESNSRQRS